MNGDQSSNNANNRDIMPEHSTNNTEANNFKNKNRYNHNGFDANRNKFKDGQQNKKAGEEVAMAIDKARQNAKKEKARNAIRTGLNTYMPGAGEVADKALKTEKGDKLLDAYAKGSTEAEGLRNVAAEIKKDTQRKKMILGIATIFLPIIFLVLIFVIVFKNADTQIYSNENKGQIETEEYPDNDLINPNIFIKYPGIYEKVEAAAKKVSRKYKVEIDRFLILATLLAPIENGNVTPIRNGTCGADECYLYDGKQYNWEDFLELWGEQSEYLAKAQILTYISQDSTENVTCGEDKTMEQYAKNDLKVNEFNFWALFNPINWFTGFRDKTGAEVNAKCVDDAPTGKATIPTVYVLSKEQGDYYNSVTSTGERDFVKDPNSGGVYFWNLLNQDGFINVYLKDYLNSEGNLTDDEKYQKNLPTILDLTNYIYSYYESIKKDCNGFYLVESTIEKIKVKHKNDNGYDLIDFEDQYIGGVIMAEFASGNLEAEKAMAILARTEAFAIVGSDGSGVIENSSNDQNYAGSSYNPTYDPSYENQEDNPNYDPDWPKVHLPKIYQAVQETKGIVIANYASDKVKHTEYDAFCPVKNTLENGFYYLPDGQRNLPINPNAYEQKTGSSLSIADKYLECPCFQNASSRPTLTSPGYPPQNVPSSCFRNGKYKATGGHGRGASQYGLKYYASFGYDYEALLKLFFNNISLRRLSSSLEQTECQNATTYSEVNGNSKTGGGGTVNVGNLTYEVSDSNHTNTLRGRALEEPIADALAKKGYTIDDLNQCIAERVEKAGPGTREGVSEAAVALIECTYDMTGGYTMPYDHSGGKVEGHQDYNPDIYGKLGVNSRWGKLGGTCDNPPCRSGLNCANFVHWSLCNGGMDMCTKGSAGASSMTSKHYFPEATSIMIQGNRAIYKWGEDLTKSYSTGEIIRMAQIGDVLYSEHADGTGQHAMVIVGVDDSGIYIAENGRNTRKISYSAITGGSVYYRFVFLDEYYANSANLNDLY